MMSRPRLLANYGRSAYCAWNVAPPKCFPQRFIRPSRWDGAIGEDLLARCVSIIIGTLPHDPNMFCQQLFQKPFAPRTHALLSCSALVSLPWPAAWPPSSSPRSCRLDSSRSPTLVRTRPTSTSTSTCPRSWLKSRPSFSPYVSSRSHQTWHPLTATAPRMRRKRPRLRFAVQVPAPGRVQRLRRPLPQLQARQQLLGRRHQADPHPQRRRR